MDNFFKSIGESISKKASSGFLCAYTFFWVTFHWEGIYTTIFTDQEKIFERFGLLKNEYVAKYFFGYKGWDDWYFYAGFLLPLGLSYGFIWLLPRFVLLPAFVKEREYKLNKQKVVIGNEIKIEAHRAALATKSKKALEAEEKVAKKRKNLAELDPGIAWSQEYSLFEDSGLSGILSVIAESVYEHGGHVKRYVKNNRWTGIDLDRDTIAIAHTNDLIDISDDTISLTDKGKYFLGRSYQNKFD